jgi:hypothetical protein
MQNQKLRQTERNRTMKITSYEVLGKLPDLFTFDDGRKVRSVSDWEMRRKELYKTVVEIQYGDLLPEPEFMEIIPLMSRREKGMMSIYKIVTGTREKPVSFTIYCHMPGGNCPFPVVIDGDLCYSCMQNADIAQKFIDRGIMLVAFNRCEIVPDLRNPSRKGNLYETYSDLEFGALAAWAWGYSRTLDAVIELGLTDPACVAFTGLSRGGKTALLAGAFDERFKYVISNDSGFSGAAITRGKEGEHAADLLVGFGRPDWFCPRYQRYITDETKRPLDQHFLLALVAPRHLIVGSAEEDLWADPASEFLGAYLASEVYEKIYNIDGLIHENVIPTAKTVLDKGNVMYHVRHGVHYMSREDWLEYMSYIDKHLK